MRGATTVEADDREQLTERVVELLTEMASRNDVAHDDWVSVLFTVTGDISSMFPAEAARRFGLTDVPLMCSLEIPVPGSLAMCVRVMAHLQTDRARSELRHVFLHRAATLPTSLPQ